MANVTKVMRNVDHIWPNGTSVSLYNRTQRDGAYVANGLLLGTASVTAGALTFAGVPDDLAGLIAVGAGKSVATGAGKLSWAAAH